MARLKRNAEAQEKTTTRRSGKWENEQREFEPVSGVLGLRAFLSLPTNLVQLSCLRVIICLPSVLLTLDIYLSAMQTSIERRNKLAITSHKIPFSFNSFLVGLKCLLSDPLLLSRNVCVKPIRVWAKYIVSDDNCRRDSDGGHQPER